MDVVQKTVEDMSLKVNAMHDVMMQAKGARWLILGAAGLLGFLTSLLGKSSAFWRAK